MGNLREIVEAKLASEAEQAEIENNQRILKDETREQDRKEELAVFENEQLARVNKALEHTDRTLEFFRVEEILTQVNSDFWNYGGHIEDIHNFTHRNSLPKGPRMHPKYESGARALFLVSHTYPVYVPLDIEDGSIICGSYDDTRRQIIGAAVDLNSISFRCGELKGPSRWENTHYIFDPDPLTTNSIFAKYGVSYDISEKVNLTGSEFEDFAIAYCASAVQNNTLPQDIIRSAYQTEEKRLNEARPKGNPVTNLFRRIIG